jgi:type II secretory pathway pseudopilin PulG
LIVVIVILGVMAAVIVPRFMGTARQEASVAADRVGELMRLFAYRQALSSQQVGLWRDGADGRMHLLVMDADPKDPSATPEWRSDRFASVVTLPSGVDVTDVRVNDQRQRNEEWLVASVPGGARPKIEIRVVGNGVDATLVLPAGSPSVVRIDEGQLAPFVRTPIDLDRAGRDQEPW